MQPKIQLAFPIEENGMCSFKAAFIPDQMKPVFHSILPTIQIVLKIINTLLSKLKLFLYNRILDLELK